MSGAGEDNRGGFTMLELGVVIVITALVAATAIPAFDQVRVSRQAAARSEVLSQLRNARAHAMALGDSCGLSLDPEAGSCQLLTVPPGDAAKALLDPLGAPEPPVELGVRYPGSAISEVTLFDGSSGAGVLWFSNTGTPELRDEAGDYIGSATDDAEVTVEGMSPIFVDHLTGHIR